MKMLLLGDVCPTNETAPLFAQKDITTLFSDVVTLFEKADYSFVNLECALTDSDNAIAKFGPNLKAPAETAQVLKELGVDCCGLSNNHVFDFGIPGVRDTLKNLEEAGLEWTGFGENYEDSRKDHVIERNGEKIAIITVCEHEYSYALEDRMGSRPWDEFDTIEDIRKAKVNSDRVIVIYHGGKELCRYPSPRLHRLCRAMVKNGADVVLCQHSHCIGTYEKYGEGHILYGQGNFHFVKHTYAFDGWYNCMAVHYDTKTNEIGFTPISAGDKGISLAAGQEKETLMAEFETRNAELLTGGWKAGWHAFCEDARKNYINVIGNACKENSTPTQNAHFGHYLDCEAHTDVWRELFPTYNQTNEK